MFVKALYDEVRLYINQGQSQYYSPDEVMTAFNRAQTDKYREEYIAFESTQRITDALRNFKKTVEQDVNVDGFFNLPIDYYNITAISSLVAVPDTTPVQYEEYEGKVFTDGEWLLAAQSELLPPEEKNIKARIINGKIDVLPKSVNKINIYYLKEPATAVYAYDLINDKITFNEGRSVDTEFPKTEHTDLILRTLKYLGISMKDEVSIQAEKIVNG